LTIDTFEQRHLARPDQRRDAHLHAKLGSISHENVLPVVPKA
jgi:hypothetical protein